MGPSVIHYQWHTASAILYVLESETQEICVFSYIKQCPLVCYEPSEELNEVVGIPGLGMLDTWIIWACKSKFPGKCTW